MHFQKRLNLFCLIGTITLAALGLISYIPGNALLGSIGSNYIPMAPSTAVSFILLCIAMSKYFVKPTLLNIKYLSVINLTVILVTLFGFLQVLGYLTNLDLNLENLMVPDFGKAGNVPIGRMSPSTGGLFFCFGVAFLLFPNLHTKREGIRKHFSGYLSVFVLLVSATFLLGYLYRTPLLYDNQTIPMALTTALCFIFVSTGLISCVSVESFPINLFHGDLTRAKLMRMFLPLSFLAGLTQGILHSFMYNSINNDINNVLLSSILIIIVIGVTAIAVSYCSTIIGDQIDRLQQERLQAEEELIRLSTAIEQVGDTIIIFGIDGIVQYVNPALEKQLQYNRDELIGMDIANVNKDTLKAENFKKVWETINKGELWSGNIIRTRKDGSQFTANVNISPVFDDTGKIICFTSIGRDITKEQQMEEQRRQSQKMEAMGTLAGGIAHDFNNILGGILGYTELAQDDAVQDSPVQEYLVEILKSTTRARALVKQILTFSRKSHEERKPVLLHPVIQEAAKLIRSTIPTTIEIKQNINDTTGMVNADSTQMHQIIMNLCTNAFHAMQETGGMLEIELSSVVITQESMREYHDISPGPFLELRISDTGTGIDSKIIHKIFDPFFTTKDKEKGTGMGLAVVFGIVKDHGGDIKIDSQLGKGTTFRIMLPQVIAEPDNKEDSSSKVPTGTEHILFVDDEEILIDLAKRIFESLGYTVTAKNSSIEALETFQKSPDTFDMVITDQTMPHMTGYNLAKRILEIKPSANIILCTGYSETVSLEKAEAAGIKTLVYKPISKKEIAQKIRGVLDKQNHEKH